MIYLTLGDLVHVAQRAVGGQVDVRDYGLLESALARPQATAFGADVYPALDDFSNYRARVWATLDILIDPKYNAYLRVGALDRYNSRPDGSPRNSVDYYLGLLFGF